MQTRQHQPQKLSGSVHKHGTPGSRTKADVNVRAGAHAPDTVCDMPESAMKSSNCAATKARVNRKYGYKQTVHGNEGGK